MIPVKFVAESKQVITSMNKQLNETALLLWLFSNFRRFLLRINIFIDVS